MQVVSLVEARQEEAIRRILEHCGLWQGPPPRLPPARPPPVRRRPPPPREIQLLLAPDFAYEITGSGAEQDGLLPRGPQLVPDPDYLAECHREAEGQETVVRYD
jgi:hypothetical protein